MSRGYNTGDGQPLPAYWIVHRRSRTIELTAAVDVPDAIGNACEAIPPAGPEEDRSGDRLSRAAGCVTSRAKTRVASRSIDTPGFIERFPAIWMGWCDSATSSRRRYRRRRASVAVIVVIRTSLIGTL